MEDHSISIQDFSNYLQSGAVLRHQNLWYLFRGHKILPNKATSLEFSVFMRNFFNRQSTFHIPESPDHLPWIIESSFLQKLCQRHLDKGTMGPVATPVARNLVWVPPLFSEFQEAFNSVQEKIKKGTLQKAVITATESAIGRFEGCDRARALLSLIAAPENLWVYGFWHDRGGILGATPEILFSLERNQLTTMALAGTRPLSPPTIRGDIADPPPPTSLLDDPKELKEHRFVVEDIVSALTPLTNCAVSETVEVSYPSLKHLRTDIKAELNHAPSPLDLVDILHPTAALGIFPRDQGYHWLQQLPGQRNRGLLGSPLVFKLGEGKWLAIVAIRNVQWDVHQLYISAGCGIVSESLSKREWSELETKRNMIKKLLAFSLENGELIAQSVERVNVE